MQRQDKREQARLDKAQYRAQRKRDKQHKKHVRAFERELKIHRKTLADEHKTKLRLLKELGLYNPTSSKLTKSRIQRVESVWNKYGNLFNPEQYFMITLPKGLRNKKRFAEFKTRTRGVSFDKYIFHNFMFFPKNKFQSVKMKYDKDLGEYVLKPKKIVRSKKKKRIVIEQTIPVVGLDVLIRNQEKLVRAIRRKMDGLKKGEVFAFWIGNNISRSSFKDPEYMVKTYFWRYVDSNEEMQGFLNHVVIEKMTFNDWRDNLAEQGQGPSGEGETARDLIDGTAAMHHTIKKKRSKRK